MKPSIKELSQAPSRAQPRARHPRSFVCWPARCYGVALASVLALTACRDEPAPSPNSTLPTKQTPAEPSTTNSHAAGNGTASERTPSAAPPSVVFLGDSLTAGRGLAASEALPTLIQKRVDEAGLGYRVVNGGRSGDTTAGGLARLDWYLRPSVGLDVLVIGLGSNDAMRGLPLTEMEKNLTALIQRVRAQAPNVEILLWELRTFPNMGESYGEGFQAVFQRVAKSQNVRLIPFPLEGVAAVPELNQDDGIHPTAQGTSKVADNVWQVLGPVLSERQSSAPRATPKPR